MKMKTPWLVLILSCFMMILTGCSEGQSGGTGIDDGDQYRRLEVHGNTQVAQQPMRNAEIKVYLGANAVNTVQTDDAGRYQFTLEFTDAEQHQVLKLTASQPLAQNNAQLQVSSYIGDLHTLSQQADSAQLLTEQQNDTLSLTAVSNGKSLALEQLNQGEAVADAATLVHLAPQLQQDTVIESAVLTELIAVTQGQYVPESSNTDALLQDSQQRQQLNTTLQTQEAMLYQTTLDDIGNSVKQVIAPSVDAGADQTVASFSTVQLSASASSQNNGSIDSYHWQLAEGADSIQLSNATSANPSFTAPNVAETTGYLFWLTVTDTVGASSTDSVLITVQPLPHQVNISSNQSSYRPNQTVLLSSSLSNFSAVQSYSWESISSNDYNIDFGDTSADSLSFSAPDVDSDYQHSFRLTVVDEWGNSHSAELTITFEHNAPPVYTGQGGWVTHDAQTLTIQGDASDSDGSIVSYQWQQSAGDPLNIVNDSANQAALQIEIPNLTQQSDFTFTVQITDNDGATTSATIPVTINQFKPVLQPMTDLTVNIGDNVYLSAQGTDADGQIVSYQWQQISNNTSVTLDSSDSATTRFTAPHSQDDLVLGFQVTAIDNDGFNATEVVSVTVTGRHDSHFSYQYPTEVLSNQAFNIQLDVINTQLTVNSYQFSLSSGPAPYYVTANNNSYDAIAPGVLGSSVMHFEISVDTIELGAITETLQVRVLPIAEPTFMPKRDSVTSAGLQTENGQASFLPAFSPDNSQLLFFSTASNFDDSDDNGNLDIFIKDLATANVTRAMIPGGALSDPDLYPSYGPALSLDQSNSQLCFISDSDQIISDANFDANSLVIQSGVNDNGAIPDVFKLDLTDQTIQLLSHDNTLFPAMGISNQTLISADGHYMIFSAETDDIALGDENVASDVFIYELIDDTQSSAAQIQTISKAADNSGTANGESKNPAINSQNSYVVYDSTATNLTTEIDDQTFSDIFIYDVANKSNSRLTLTQDGLVPNGHSYRPQISDDGRYVAFLSEASNWVSDGNDVTQLYLWDRQDNNVSLVSRSSDGSIANSPVSSFALAHDGSAVAFATAADNLSASDSNQYSDIFVRRVAQQQTYRVNQRSLTQQTDAGCHNPVFSSDLHWLAFDCDASNLVDNDSNAATDVFKMSINLDAIEALK